MLFDKGWALALTRGFTGWTGPRLIERSEVSIKLRLVYPSAEREELL